MKHQRHSHTLLSRLALGATPQGSLATLLDPDGGRTTYSYDGLNRLTSLINPLSERTTWQYDALSRVTTLTLANGAYATYAYDAAGRVTRVANVKSGGTIISSFDYSYDAIGNPTGLVEANGDRVTWSYDAKYQLTRERRSGTNAYDITYTYDAVGNRLTKLTGGATTTYTYDAANQLTVENAGGTLTTCSYDANGNLATQNAGGAVTTYTWDGENRMATATLPGGAVTTFTYAANGLRRKTEVGGTTKVFVWDSQDVLLETDGSGTTQATYTQGMGRYGPLVAQRRSGASSFYHFDALGSTTELSNSGQTVTDTCRYYAFGETKASTGSATNPFGYVGRLGYYGEATLGLQYLRARWYKPAAGRFLSTDPVGARSRYGYVGDGPVGAVDPSGMQQQPDGLPGVGATRCAGGVGCPRGAGSSPSPLSHRCRGLRERLDTAVTAVQGASESSLTEHACAELNQALYWWLTKCYQGGGVYDPLRDSGSLPKGSTGYRWPGAGRPAQPDPDHLPPQVIQTMGAYQVWLSKCHHRDQGAADSPTPSEAPAAREAKEAQARRVAEQAADRQAAQERAQHISDDERNRARSPGWVPNRTPGPIVTPLGPYEYQPGMRPGANLTNKRPPENPGFPKPVGGGDMYRSPNPLKP